MTEQIEQEAPASEAPIDGATAAFILEQRNWLLTHRTQTGASWAELERRTGIPAGTLQTFASGKYGGRNDRVAEKIERYRKVLVSQQQMAVELPETPGYYETDTSRELTDLLTVSQARRRIVVATMGPGTGKTITARNFTNLYPYVWLATMRPSSAGLNTMQIEVLKAMGEPNAVGTPQKLTHAIMERMRHLQCLLMIDEAQNLTEKAIEEIRSWHDEVGCGIALLGDMRLDKLLKGGSKGTPFAQVNSRVMTRMERPVPLVSDADALAIAWNVQGEREIAYIRKQAVKPGGLRGVTMMMEVASMIAVARGEVLAVDHMQDAWAQLPRDSVLQ